ncbi:E3 ubiquitin-protein ligase HERC2-like [Clarias gariepinus]
MLCYWGEAVKPDGFGLVKPDSVRFTDTGIGYLSPKSRISDVSPGKSLMGFIRGDGNASVLRLNTREQVKSGKLNTVDLKKEKIGLIICGDIDAVLLEYEDGRIFFLDKSNVCRPIKELCSQTVIQVACGNQHFMALTNDGQLFTWGQNTSGQLGLGKGEPSSLSPQHLKYLCGIPLAQISAGGDHSFALSLSGAVFSWGRNSAGQLGLGHNEDIYIPTCVSNLSQKKTVSISCGEEHTATLSKGGTVFSFGSGRHGQLGHNSFRDELQPRVVTGLWGLNVSQITCGRNHTLALVKSSNTIYSFGCGEQGQLGNGQRSNQCVPLPVQLPSEATNIHTVERVIARKNQSFVLCSHQESESNYESNRGEIVTLSERMIDSWVSECEEQWMTVKKEIKRVFSSAACLNGSFIMKSCDRHYRTSTHYSGLDLESVKAALEHLAKKEKVLLEVAKVVEEYLLPSLGFTAVDVEALRVFLILQNFWSELPGTFLKTLVELFRTPSAKTVSKMAIDFVSTYTQEKGMIRFLKKSVQILQMIYKASCKSHGKITPGDFIINETSDLVDMLYTVQYGIHIELNWTLNISLVLRDKECLKQTLKFLISSPCIFNLEAKYNLLKFIKSSIQYTKGIFRMKLRRTALLEDCFQLLRDVNKEQLKCWLQVVYCENFEDSDVNKKDFFHNASSMLLDPELDMFIQNDTNTLIWFPSEPSLPEEWYFLLGLLCGLAFNNNCVVHMPFPLALFKKLLNIRPSLEDFAELSPVTAQSLQYLLNYTDDDADNMAMAFTIVWDNVEVELDPDKPGKDVTSTNKNLFVELYVDYVLNKSVDRVFNEFKRGFYKVCDRNMVNFFQPEELRAVMLGSEKYDWDTFKMNAIYGPVFHKDHPTIVSFWEVFEEMSNRDKKAFLLFLTGFDQVPVLGMGQVRMNVQPLNNATQDHLPQAHTCFAMLELPVYKTKQTLRKKLTEAIHHRRGFWEEYRESCSHTPASQGSIIMFFSWGDSSRGQLALPGSEGNGITRPTSVHSTEQLVGISCGEQHTLFLTVGGQVLSCGRNSKGQLGRSKSRDTHLPVKIDGLGAVAAVACGQDHSLALCDSGQVFSWGAGGEGQLGHSSPVAKCPKPVPVQIELLVQIPVVQVACGNFHSLALTKGGEVFSWGQNKYGQLGLGKSVELQPDPCLVRSLVGVPVTQIAAGGAHTLALTLHGQVFCCGANSVGQLGLNRTDAKGRFLVCAVPALRKLRVSSISCGEAHTAVLNKAGDVYTFGDGAHGQLGHGSTNNELLPKKVEGIDGPAKQVTCGSHHTLVLMPSGTLFTFGRNVQAQASGATEIGLQPVRLEGTWNSTGAGIHTEMKISSGYSSNFLFFSASKNNILGEPIGKLEETQVQRWVTVLECEKSIKEMKREVSLTFATSSNLVACFIKDSRDTQGTIQVDVNAASQTFDQLLKIPWIKNTVNITHVVDLLLYAAPLMRCTEIFLLLPTCSILHEQHNVTRLVLPLAVAITDLSETAIKSLKEHWSSMDANIMTKHIRMWKQALIFLLKSNLWKMYNPGVKAVLKVLKLLYQVNKRAEKSRKVPLSEFYIEEIGTTPHLLEWDVVLWQYMKMGLVMEEDQTDAIFCRYPFLLDLTTKISVFKYNAEIIQLAHQFIHIDAMNGGLLGETSQSEVPTPILKLKVRRTALLEDTFRQLNNADHDNFKKTLVVQFVEDSKLTEVHKQDFFLHIFNELLDPKSGMFKYNDKQTMIWFPAKPTQDLKQYFLFGILCGLALCNNNIVHMPFPLALFKKLVDVKPTLEDLTEFSPVVGKGLQSILHEYPDDVVDDLNIPFCVHWDGDDVDLNSHKNEKSVTSDNKKEFVEAYVDYALNKSVERVFNEFTRGFYKVCDKDVVNFFQPEELRGVMVGTEEYDWDTFRQNTVYIGQYHERHPAIVAFWEVFEDLTHEQKKAFLLFLTGCDRVPILGMKQVKMTMLDRTNFTQDHFPESLTCHSYFMLPTYENKQRLESKLIEAINHNRGFWIEDAANI